MQYFGCSGYLYTELKNLFSMSNIKNHFSTMLMGICSGLLSLLGFGCSSEEQPCMYGQPMGDFEIKGIVTTEDGDPVEDAEIRVTHSDAPSGVYSLETTSTNAVGDYIAVGRSYGDHELKVVCLPSNSQLEPDSVVVEMHYNKDNAGTWYVGDAKEIVNFKLKSKTAVEE